MKIGIVGCGVGGMAAAIALSRAGHAVAVFERFDAPKPLGAGLLLQPTGLAALQALGLRETVEAKGARVNALRGETPGGRRVLDLEYARWRPGAYGLGVHRASLFDALYETLKTTPVSLHADCEIVQIDSLSRPVLRDARDRAHGPFDLVIAADGAASPLRTAIAPKARAPLYPWGAIWTIRPDPQNSWAGVLAQRYAGAQVMIGVLPVGAAPGAAGPHVAFFWSLREDAHAAWRAAGPEAWRGEVARFWPRAATLLEGDLDFAGLPFARYRDVRAWPWGQGATILIGDSAHGTSPQLGQGANLALADAVALAAALKREAPPRALAAYRRDRRSLVAWTQFMSSALTPVFQSRSRLLGWVRDLALPLACKVWPFNRLMLATLTGAARLPSWPKRFAVPRAARGVPPR